MSALGLRAAKGLTGFGDEFIQTWESCHRPTSCPIAQWSEYSHGLLGVLGSSPSRVMYFFLLCDISINLVISKSSQHVYS